MSVVKRAGLAKVGIEYIGFFLFMTGNLAVIAFQGANPAAVC